MSTVFINHSTKISILVTLTGNNGMCSFNTAKGFEKAILCIVGSTFSLCRHFSWLYTTVLTTEYVSWNIYPVFIRQSQELTLILSKLCFVLPPVLYEEIHQLHTNPAVCWTSVSFNAKSIFHFCYTIKDCSAMLVEFWTLNAPGHCVYLGLSIYFYVCHFLSFGSHWIIY